MKDSSPSIRAPTGTGDAARARGTRTGATAPRGLTAKVCFTASIRIKPPMGAQSLAPACSIGSA